jgi:hypothetical protein
LSPDILSLRTFCPAGRFVSTDVLSLRIFCLYGCFVPTDVLSHGCYVSGRFLSGRFVSGCFVPTDVLSGRFVWAPIILYDILICLYKHTDLSIYTVCYIYCTSYHMEVSGNGHLTHVSSPKHPTYIWYFKKSHATVPLKIGYQLDGYRAACSEVCLVSNPKLKAKD